MKNKALAIFGVVAFILSVISSAVDPSGNSVASPLLIVISAVATSIFLVMAVNRLWVQARSFSLMLASSALLLLLLTCLNQFSAFSYGSRELIWFNVVRVGYFVAYVLAVIKLFQIKEEFQGDIGPNAVLAFDERWEYVQDRLCLVTAFRPGAGHAVVNGVVNSNIKDAYGLYCQIDLQCKSVFGDKKLDGLITHREDFKNLWGAFKERAVNTDTEEVLLVWSSTHYKDKHINFVANYLRQRVFMPKILVLVCHKGTYEQFGQDYKWAMGDKPQDVVRDLKAITWCAPEVMS